MTDRWGTPRGIIDIRPNEGTAERTTQALFKRLYDSMEHFVSVGYAERVALNYGLAGTGTDFWDGANPFTNNAWFVYRMPPTQRRFFSYYVHVQYAYGVTFGDAPANPALFRAAQGLGAGYGHVGIQYAIALDADRYDANPWAGTSNFDGADTKGSIVWKAPMGGKVFVFPRSNSSAHSANKENHQAIHNDTASIARMDVVFDGDHLMIWYLFQDGTLHDFSYSGPFKPRDDLRAGSVLESGAVPFVVFHGSNDGPGTSTGLAFSTYGDAAGSAFDNGGILVSYEEGVRRLLPLSGGASSDWNNRLTPDHDIGTEQGDPIYAVDLAVDDNPYFGILGQSYSRKWGYVDSAVVNQNDLFPAAAPYRGRVYQNGGTTPAWNFVFPWAGNQAPQSSSTRDGVVI